MKKLLAIILFSLFCSTVLSEEWVSPIDRKYLAKNPELFSKFDSARTILNSWRGQRVKLKKAADLLKVILENDKEFAPAYREYGRLSSMAGYVYDNKFREEGLSSAESFVLKAIELEPDYADAFVLLGNIYTNMGRFEDAKKSLEKAEVIGTEIPWLQMNWADLLRKQHRYNEAMKRYQYIVLKGTSNRKAYSRALQGVTRIYKILRQYDKANESYQKEIEYDPDDPWKWGNYSSFLLFTYNDVDGAIEKGQKALRIMDYGMGRFVLACALYTKWAILRRDNKQEEAKIYFDQAWRLFPYPEKVIERTSMYKHTKITAATLRNWLKRKSS